MEILKSIINWIFPKKCISCGREITEESVFCPACFKDIVFVDYPYCKCCGKQLHPPYSEDFACDVCQNTDRYFDLCRALFLYNRTSKKIIMRIKKEADESVARACVELLCSKYLNTFKNVDVIVPVPLHIARLLYRGFNQSEIIAKHISKVTEIPSNNDIIKRIKKTKSQQNKGIEERRENVRGAFDVVSDVSGLSVLLVDDVMTTGATLSECSKTLKEHGASQVCCATIAGT
jgi:ComF family protein